MRGESASDTIKSHRGKVARVNRAGLCYVEEIDSREIYCFKFDRIDGYVGQSAKQLGLCRDSRVTFTTDAQRLVQSVELAA